MGVKIFCPCCSWAPGAGDMWECRPGCLTVWNTFETRARCPGCRKQWRVTECLMCGLGSPHEEWYHDDSESTEAWEDSTEREEELVGVGEP